MSFSIDLDHVNELGVIVTIGGTLIVSFITFHKYFILKDHVKERKRSELEISKLVSINNDKKSKKLSNSYAFDYLTGKSAPTETIEAIFNCHDPYLALSIYETAPGLIQVSDVDEDGKAQFTFPKYLHKGSSITKGFELLSVFTVFGILFILLSLQGLLNNTPTKDIADNTALFFILISFVLISIIIALIFLNYLLSELSLFTRVRKFYASENEKNKNVQGLNHSSKKRVFPLLRKFYFKKLPTIARQSKSQYSRRR